VKDERAEQVKCGASVHLALEHLDLRDGGLDLAEAVRQVEAVRDGLLFVADSGGEGAQLRLAVGCLRGEPGLVTHL
jgi:hypothetical protein